MICITLFTDYAANLIAKQSIKYKYRFVGDTIVKLYKGHALCAICSFYNHLFMNLYLVFMNLILVFMNLYCCVFLQCCICYGNFN